MIQQLVLKFDNTDELMKVLDLLKKHNLEKSLFFKAKRPSKNQPSKGKWQHAGVGNLNALDSVNLRDYAYE